MTGRVVIVGASTRAAAQSALRAGLSPWCVDLFADRDLSAIAPVLRCPGEQYPRGLLQLVEQAPPGPVLCTGAMENHPEVLEAIAQCRPLLGSSPAAVRSVRNPQALARLQPVPGLRCCRVCDTAPNHSEQRYLLKPRHSAGGGGIHFWSPEDSLDARHYLQEYVPGTPISAIYHAHGPAARLLGVTEQFIGEPDFGARGFQYCGGIGPISLAPKAVAALTSLGDQLVGWHGLGGLFGVDMILDAQGDLWPVEVNPRYTASVELIERATGLAALADRPSAFATGNLHAKAIIFARQDCRVPDLFEFFSPDEVADVPEVDDFTPSGRPICTLLAHGPDREACVRRLREEAQRLYTRLS